MISDTIYKVQQIFLNYVKIEYFFFELIHLLGQGCAGCYTFERELVLEVVIETGFLYLEILDVGSDDLAFLVEGQYVLVRLTDGIQYDLRSRMVVVGDMDLDFVGLLVKNELLVDFHLAHIRTRATQHHVYGLVQDLLGVVVGELDVERDVDLVLDEAGLLYRLAGGGVYATVAEDIGDIKDGIRFVSQFLQQRKFRVIEVGEFLEQDMRAVFDALDKGIQ